jgi:hypothetical protein
MKPKNVSLQVQGTGKPMYVSFTKVLNIKIQSTINIIYASY